jgi:hypothetical protein
VDENLSNKGDSAKIDMDEDQINQFSEKTSISGNNSIVSAIDTSAISSDNALSTQNSGNIDNKSVSPFNNSNPEIVDVDSMTAEKSTQSLDQESISHFSQGDTTNMNSEVTPNVSDFQNTSVQNSTKTDDLVSPVKSSRISEPSEVNTGSPTNLDHVSDVSNLDTPSPVASVTQSHVSNLDNQSLVSPQLSVSPDKSVQSNLDEQSPLLTNQSPVLSTPSVESGNQSLENDFNEQSPKSESYHSEISLTNVKDNLEASPAINSIQEVSHNVDNESIQSNQFDVNQSINDEDAIEEAIDGISTKGDTLDDQLAKLDQLSNVGELEASTPSESKSMESKDEEVVQNIVQKQVNELLPSEVETQTINNSVMNLPQEVDNTQQTNKLVDSLEKKTKETPIEDQPLTEDDKKMILEELEGKDVNMHINHKSIESLHHINVYHYMPPKFISGQSLPYLYPGMVPQQPQQMTPGPIINIHNSTSSSSGSGSGSNSGASANGQAVVNNALPTQNWGQVVYSNHNHGSNGGGVTSAASGTPSVIQLDSAAKVDTPLAQSNQVEPVIQQVIPSKEISNQTPNVITTPNPTPEIINNPKIEMGKEIKVDPIINSEIENESADISISDKSTKSSDSLNSQDSDDTLENETHKETVSFHNGDMDPHKADHDDLQPMINPSELSDFDEETVHVDPHKVNKREGQSVILGGDDSPKTLDNQSKLFDIQCI